MPPKVSIIIPVYNVEAYLDQCVQSVLNQTLKEIEIILVDDESPDHCPAMCDEYAKQDSRVKVIHKKNCGLGFARNSGLDVATGEYVAFVDSDDFIAPDMMRTLYHTAIQYGADEVRSGVIFYEDGKETVRHDVDKITVFRGKEEVKRFVLDYLGPAPEEYRDCKYMMSVWLALHSRKVIEENRIRFTSERQTLSEDMVFGMELFPKLDCAVCIPNGFYYYRKNTQSLTHQFSWEKYKQQETLFKAVRERLDIAYTKEEYWLHYLRMKFLYMRNCIRQAFSINASFWERRKLAKAMLRDEVWYDLFTEYPYFQLPRVKRIYFFLAKHKMTSFLFFITKMMKYRSLKAN
ncbi:glycosyltransferase family 2 protein [Phocaeicola sp.]